MAKRMLKTLVLGLAAAMTTITAQAADWSWQWPATPGDAAPQVQVCHFKYGKDWAYAVEIDDGPLCALTAGQPLLANYQFTDAPPGVPGGKPVPFVGGVGVIVTCLGTTNLSILQFDQLHKLQDAGWDILNHSYYHIGHSYGNPPEILTPAQLRRDLFWSQTVLGTEVGLGQNRAPTHFIYPNGYMDFQKYLTACTAAAASAARARRPSTPPRPISWT
jgi:peptidoglycan/xylan/chitin deacetylase (PgdA/CDA1 family)